MLTLRPWMPQDRGTVLRIVNEAARRYCGVIPEDRWRDPYMPGEELDDEIASGVEFLVARDGDETLGLMGLQERADVALVRHAYVAPHAQGRGVGTALLNECMASTGQPVLIGTWAAATWAIDFYRRNGFTLVPAPDKDALLRRYWSIPERQIETSVVLADGRWMQRER